MVEVKNYEADRFLKSRSPEIWLYLFFGPDSGLVWERLQSIVSKSVDDPRDPFQLLRMDGDAVAVDPQKLCDEANTIGLFGGRRCIWIDAGSKGFATALEPLIKDPPPDCTVIISAGDIKADSPLRKTVSRYKGGATVECYPDSVKQLELIVDEETKRKGMSISPGARDFLVSHLGADRLVTRSELEKLLLYAHGMNSISEAHVEAVIADAAALSVDEAIFLAFTGDYRTTSEAGYRTLTHIDAGAFIGLILRHVLMLHRLRIELDNGASLESVTSRLPRIYFGSKKAQVTSQLRNWSSAALLQMARELSGAANSARRDARSAERLAIRSLWWIVRGSRRAA